MTIDYVVPMVFPQDVMWRHDYLSANGMWCDDKSTLTNQRYRTWGTEEILIRLIRKNLPWIRRIHILLARPTQVQDWMKPLLSDGKHPDVRVVFHKSFMPKEKLPTFNSRAIEMYLHRIPDLAPMFLYGNDDMFPLSPMPVEDFFRNGLPCLHLKTKDFPSQPGQYHKACLGGLNFVARNFGKHYSTTWLHTGHSIAPMLRATIEMFWQRWPEDMERSVTTFRQSWNFNQYIYLWWQYLSGQYIDHHPERDYVATNRHSPDEIRKAIATTNGILCINDHDGADDLEPYARVAREGLQFCLSK